MLRLLSSKAQGHFWFFNLNPVMLVLIGYLLLSTLIWVPICQGFNHFWGFLHDFVLHELATSSIGLRVIGMPWLLETHTTPFAINKGSPVHQISFFTHTRITHPITHYVVLMSWELWRKRPSHSSEARTPCYILSWQPWGLFWQAWLEPETSQTMWLTRTSFPKRLWFQPDQLPGIAPCDWTPC